MTTEVDCCGDESVKTHPQNQPFAARIRSWVLTPRGLAVAGIAGVAGGLALNWSWLVAVGAAPLILSFGPCAAMCALGLCMNMRGHQRSPTAAPGDGSPHEPTTLAVREAAPKTR